jgi:hypothetical protein
MQAIIRSRDHEMIFDRGLTKHDLSLRTPTSGRGEAISYSLHKVSFEIASSSSGLLAMTIHRFVISLAGALRGSRITYLQEGMCVIY